ncbi:MAG: hypothetical protein ACTSU6_06105 [Candidatus Njordarchaeales archaeon]
MEEAILTETEEKIGMIFFSMLSDLKVEFPKQLSNDTDLTDGFTIEQDGYELTFKKKV